MMPRDDVVRTPVFTAGAGDPPACFAMYRGERDPKCVRCGYARDCAQSLNDNRAQRTVRDAADSAVLAWRRSIGLQEVHPEDLAMLCQRLFIEKGGQRPFKPWGNMKPWQDACERVIAACRQSGTDPRLYIRAQVETIGWWCMEQGWLMRPTMLAGAKAQERFENWSGRNERKYNDATRDRSLEDGWGKLVAGETLYGDLVALRGRREVSAEDEVKESFPTWTLGAFDRPEIRLPALAAVLAILDPSLPERVLMPSKAWNWITVERDLLPRIRLIVVDKPRRHSISPELGEIL